MSASSPKSRTGSAPTSSLVPTSLYTAFLFCGHAFCSVTLILMNKSIAASFPYALTLVFLQNWGTLLGAAFLWAIGVQKIHKPKRA